MKQAPDLYHFLDHSAPERISTSEELTKMADSFHKSVHAGDMRSSAALFEALRPHFEPKKPDPTMFYSKEAATLPDNVQELKALVLQLYEEIRQTNSKLIIVIFLFFASLISALFLYGADLMFTYIEKHKTD